MSEYTQNLLIALNDYMHRSPEQTKQEITKQPVFRTFMDSLEQGQDELTPRQIRLIAKGISQYTDVWADPTPFVEALVSYAPSCLFPDGINSDCVAKACLMIADGTHDKNYKYEQFITRSYLGMFEFDTRVGSLIVRKEAYDLGINESNYGEYILNQLRGAFDDVKLDRYETAAITSKVIASLTPSVDPLAALEEELMAVRLLYPELAKERSPIDFKHHTEATEEWKPVFDLLEPFFEVYGISDDPRSRELAIRWPTAMIGRTRDPGCSMQWALVLSGEGGCGKTSFGELLAIPGAPAVTVTIQEAGSKDFYSKLARTSVAILDELDDLTRRSDITQLKSEITRKTATFRAPYARLERTVKLGHVFLATMNSPTMRYSDGAGNRRYGILWLGGALAEGRKRAQYLTENAALIRCIADTLYKGGYPFDMTPELYQENKEAGEALIEQTPITEFLDSHLDNLKTLMITDSGALQVLTTQNLWEIMQDTGERYNPRKATKFINTLEAAGWERKRFTRHSSSTTYWLPAGVPEDIELLSVHPNQISRLRSTIANMEVKAFKPTI